MTKALQKSTGVAMTEALQSTSLTRVPRRASPSQLSDYFLRTSEKHCAAIDLLLLSPGRCRTDCSAGDGRYASSRQLMGDELLQLAPLELTGIKAPSRLRRVAAADHVQRGRRRER